MQPCPARSAPLLPLGPDRGQQRRPPTSRRRLSLRRNWDVNSVIDALATDNLITILAEPNLTAQSGETASFLAGGEFPIPVAGNTVNGSTTVTVQFKQFGVSLSLVPTVLSPDAAQSSGAAGGQPAVQQWRRQRADRRGHIDHSRR